VIHKYQSQTNQILIKEKQIEPVNKKVKGLKGLEKKEKVKNG